MGRGIALLFLGPRHSRWGQPHVLAASIPGKEPLPILQDNGWAPGPVWTSGKSRPNWDSIPDRPARSSVAIPLSYPRNRCYSGKKAINITYSECICSLSYPACNAHASYCHLWPAPLYNIFPHYLINGTIFEKKKL